MTTQTERFRRFPLKKVSGLSRHKIRRVSVAAADVIRRDGKRRNFQIRRDPLRRKTADSQVKVFTKNSSKIHYKLND